MSLYQAISSDSSTSRRSIRSSRLKPLDLDDPLLCLALSPSIVFVEVEIEKWFIRQGWLRLDSMNTERSFP